MGTPVQRLFPIVNLFNPGRKLKNARSNFSNLKVIQYFRPQNSTWEQKSHAMSDFKWPKVEYEKFCQKVVGKILEQKGRLPRFV